MKKNPHVLIVDDCDISRNVLSFAFEDRYDCDLAADGAEAIACLERQDYFCVLLDLVMPKVDGLGVLAFLKGRASVGVHTAAESPHGRAVSMKPPPMPPVIVLTSSTEPGIREKCLAAGAVALLNKPFKIAAINAVMENVETWQTA